MLFRGYVRSLKVCLALWLVVVTTAPAFSHDHAEGDKPHTHGLGVFSASSLPGQGYGSKTGIAPETRHSHIVIFGIEIHVPASCPWAAEQDSPLQTASFFQLSAEIGNGVQAQTLGESITPQPALAAGTAFLESAPNADAFLSRETAFSSATHLCELARGLRSGAQQI
jgi:hypothetical protein